VGDFCGLWCDVSRVKVDQQGGFGFSQEGEHWVMALMAEVCALNILACSDDTCEVLLCPYCRIPAHDWNWAFSLALAILW
jgi:hypothetical protein